VVLLDDEGSAARVGNDRRFERQPQAWLHARARLMPRLLIDAPPWVRGFFDNAWAPMKALARQIRCLPPAVWDYLQSCDQGFAVVTAGKSRYLPGPATVRSRTWQNVAFVSVEDLALDNERPLHVIGHLLDHHLGCGGDLEGRWLSEGGGVTPCWQRAGSRLPRLFALGYGLDSIACSNVRDYFAQSLAFYCRDRQRLNVADPQIEKWFRNTLWSKVFWQTMER
jgi:hypothetical protein